MVTIIACIAGLIVGALVSSIYFMNQATQLKTSRVQIATEFAAYKLKTAEAKVQNDDMEKKFNDAFSNLANRILDEKSRKFTELNATNLDNILKPLREKINDFQTKVEVTHKDSIKNNATLVEKITQLSETGRKMSDEADRLTKALKGESKTMGNWGEMVLEKILEESGLRKDHEYTMQEHLVNEHDERLHPDCIIKLPEDKHLIIDSKVSLVAYEQWINEPDEKNKEALAAKLLTSVKTHINGLHTKHYQDAKGVNSPDFVFMFVPIESSWSLAERTDITLPQYARDKRIVVVTPSTLIAVIMMISSIWKQERQSRNIMEIVRQSSALYDKFVSFVETMEKVGKSIHKSREEYDHAFDQLKSGKGNLINRVENIRKLGARNTKNLPEGLINGHEEPEAE